MSLYISISAIRACGAAAVDDGCKNESVQKQVFKIIFFKLFFLQIVCLNALNNCKFAAIDSTFCKKTVVGRKIHCLANNFSGLFFQKSDLSACGGRATVGAKQPKNRCYATDKGQGTRDKGQGTRDKGQGTRDKGQGTRDKGQGTRDKGQGTRDKGQGTRDKGQGTRDKGQGTRDKGQGTRDKGQGTPDKGQGTRDKGQGTRDKGQGTRQTLRYTMYV